jgi:hypothetical protein
MDWETQKGRSGNIFSYSPKIEDFNEGNSTMRKYAPSGIGSKAFA